MSDRGSTPAAALIRPHPDALVPGASAPVIFGTGLFVGFFEWFGSLGVFSWQVLRAAVTPPYEWRELVPLPIRIALHRLCTAARINCTIIAENDEICILATDLLILETQKSHSVTVYADRC